MNLNSKLYQPAYDEGLLRGSEEPRPWDVVDEVRRQVRPDFELLDIGCGTCRKTLALAANVRRLWGLEPSGAMRSAAAARAAELGIQNLHLVGGDAEHLPFADEWFHVVCCLVARHDTAEVWRVLKPGGVAIVEKIGEHDKRNIKAAFGADSAGPRGQFMQFAEGERRQLLRGEFERLFSSVEVRDGSWKTYLSEAGLVNLCEQTNTVRGFDRHRDAAVIQEIVDRYTTPLGIETVQHRILILAIK